MATEVMSSRLWALVVKSWETGEHWAQSVIIWSTETNTQYNEQQICNRCTQYYCPHYTTCRWIDSDRRDRTGFTFLFLYLLCWHFGSFLNFKGVLQTMLFVGALISHYVHIWAWTPGGGVVLMRTCHDDMSTTISLRTLQGGLQQLSGNWEKATFLKVNPYIYLFECGNMGWMNGWSSTWTK